LIRVGNEEYARANRSFGLTTLRDKHVKFLRDGRASFCFRGKSGREHAVVLDDRHLVGIIRHIQQLPGQMLFQYLDDAGKRQPIDSGMVNDYLREIMCENGEGFTAKDFRTWGATVHAVAWLSGQTRAAEISEAAFSRCVAATAREVAAVLGNTPAVCRKSYINPLVFTAWRDGTLEKFVPSTARTSSQLERSTLKMLRAG
ncbi:MAG TPA: hypothetical protein VIT67_13605, partial [Povalibacter sp.]